MTTTTGAEIRAVLIRGLMCALAAAVVGAPLLVVVAAGAVGALTRGRRRVLGEPPAAAPVSAARHNDPGHDHDHKEVAA